MLPAFVCVAAQAMVLGSLKHSLLEAMLLAPTGELTDPHSRTRFLNDTIGAIIKDTVADRCAVGLTDLKVLLNRSHSCFHKCTGLGHIIDLTTTRLHRCYASPPHPCIDSFVGGRAKQH